MKDIFRNKKIVIGAVSTLLILGGIGGYYMYDNHRKETIKNEISIIFTDVKEIEYGTKDYDVKKELVKNVENAEIKDFSKLDTSTIGEQTLSFTLVKDDVEKIVEHKVKIIDTKAPIIELETESKEIYVNDEYDFMSNIKEVKDEVDGAISLNNDTLEINKNATEEYNKLNKENINNDTKIANKPLKDFLIDDIEDKEEKVLYLKGCYYVDGTVDTSTVGEYKITVIAIDSNGLKTSKVFSILAKEKEIEKNTQPNINNSNNKTSNSNGNISNDITYEWVPNNNGVCPFNHPATAWTKEQALARLAELGLKESDDPYAVGPGTGAAVIPETCTCGWRNWYVNVDPDKSHKTPTPYD
ncbi:MAG: hypothetical protein RR623_07405 [Bacilli bacterium]